MFSIWDDKNYCLSWDEALEYAKMLKLSVVPTLWRGVWDEDLVKGLAEDLDTDVHEGFVVRVTDGFEYGAFRKSIAKFVRANHVEDGVHNWKMQAVIPNKLKLV